MIRCLICNQSYSRRDALQRHERNVHCSGKYTDQSQPLKEMTFRHPFSMMVTGPIDREYSQKWTGELFMELFKIDTRFRREGVPVYTILDWDGERVDGTFYEPELQPEIFPALNFKIEGVNFCCFHTGKVVITGIKTTTQIDDAVYPTLIELELYVREK